MIGEPISYDGLTQYYLGYGYPRYREFVSELRNQLWTELSISINNELFSRDLLTRTRNAGYAG